MVGDILNIPVNIINNLNESLSIKIGLIANELFMEASDMTNG